MLTDRASADLMLIADENFESIQLRRVGSLSPERGFSAFAFVPGLSFSLRLLVLNTELALAICLLQTRTLRISQR